MTKEELKKLKKLGESTFVIERLPDGLCVLAHASNCDVVEHIEDIEIIETFSGPNAKENALEYLQWMYQNGALELSCE